MKVFTTTYNKIRGSQRTPKSFDDPDFDFETEMAALREQSRKRIEAYEATLSEDEKFKFSHQYTKTESRRFDNIVRNWVRKQYAVGNHGWDADIHFEITPNDLYAKININNDRTFDIAYLSTDEWIIEVQQDWRRKNPSRPVVYEAFSYSIREPDEFLLSLIMRLI
jgi:hypothetical protein